MKPEKKTTREIATKSLRLNDIGFRLVLIPFFGIAIPLLTKMTESSNFNHWQLKLSYAYTILLAFVVWQGNRYLLFSLRSYFDWFNRPIRKIIALVVAVTCFTIPISALMLIGWYQLFKKGQVNWDVVTTSTLIIMICVLFITHVYETVFLVKDSESEMVKIEQLERAKAEAELQALKNQIDPHFMFNSLNTISYLIDESPSKARAFNEHLADVYRYILQNKGRNLVMVHEEILFLQDYFALQEIRYGQAVVLRIDIPEEVLMGYLMPPISLQVLAENAFKHNEFSMHTPLEITVGYDKEEITVTNKKIKKAVGRLSSNVGLANLQERYRLTTERSITIQETDHTFAIRLPLLKIA
jgi:LytS/YehU family sensor histidine kinase